MIPYVFWLLRTAMDSSSSIHLLFMLPAVLTSIFLKKTGLGDESLRFWKASKLVELSRSEGREYNR